MSTNKQISTANTTTESSATIHPAVTNGRPKMRLPVWPTVLIALSCAAGLRWLSAKSCLECRCLKYARMKSIPASAVYSIPTAKWSKCN